MNATQTNASSGWVLSENTDGYLRISSDLRSRDFGGETPYRRSAIFEFDLSSLPTNRIIISAFLSFYGRDWTINNSGWVQGFAGDGRVTIDDVSAGKYVAEFHYSGTSRHAESRDITEFVRGLKREEIRYAGFNVRNESAGGRLPNSFLGLTDPLLEVRVGLTTLSSRLVSTTNGQGVLLISFPSQSQRRYFLQESQDLKSWRNTVSNIVGTGKDITVTNNLQVGNPPSFFRVGGE